MLFSACSKDDDFSIVGKWNVDKTTFDITMVIDGQTQTITDEETDEGWIEFKSDGSGVHVDGDTFNWTLSDDKLTITEEDDYSFTMTLTTMTDNKVVGEWTEVEEMEGVEATMDITIELSRM